jgi:signal transduction histidine kinase
LPIPGQPSPPARRLAGLRVDINAPYAEALGYDRLDRLTLRVLWAHVLLLCGLALAHVVWRIGERYPSPLGWRPVDAEGALLGATAGLVTALAATLLHGRISNHYLWRLVATLALTSFSFHFISLSGGAAEMHFHYFLVAAYVTAYMDWRLPWAVAFVGIAHMVGLGVVLPSWVYVDGFSRVGVVSHAVSLLTMALFLTLICVNQRRRTAALVGARLALEEDIVRRHEAEVELQRTRAELAASQKLSALGTLVSGVAHEIRTPLTYLQTNVFLIQRAIERASEKRAPASDLARETAPLARATEDAVDRINRLVQDLRRFTKLEAQSHVRAGLHEVVPEAVDLFRATNRGGAAILLDLEPTRPLPLDRAQIQQVVLNLLHNAVEASPGKATITVRTRDGFAGGELIVQDQGPGIPPEVQARMYEPFFTTKGEGTGLGLSIVRRIVEAHGGHIAFETRKGRGTRFVIRFPEDPDGTPTAVPVMPASSLAAREGRPARAPDSPRTLTPEAPSPHKD